MGSNLWYSTPSPPPSLSLQKIRYNALRHFDYLWKRYIPFLQFCTKILYLHISMHFLQLIIIMSKYSRIICKHYRNRIHMAVHVYFPWKHLFRSIQFYTLWTAYFSHNVLSSPLDFTSANHLYQIKVMILHPI